MDKFTQWISKPQVWGFFASMAIMAAISLAFFAPDNFEGNSLNQSDMVQGLANGHEAQAFQEATGEKALWTNSLFSGMPTFQISPSYPSNRLFNWINSVYGLFLPSPSNLLFMMMFGFLILLYCMRMRWSIALIGAVAWGLSSYYIIIIGAGHIWKFVTLSYIPPTIGGLVLCYRRRWLLGGSLAALFAMMQLNANHPQMTYYFAFVMAGFAIAYLVEAWKKREMPRWWKGTAALAVAGVLSVGANLPSLYNTYEYAKETKRAQSELTTAADPESGVAPAERPTGGLPKSDIVNWSYGRSEMFSLLIPNIKGGASAKPEKGQMVMLGLNQLPEAATKVPAHMQQIMPYFTQYFNDSEGTNGPVYVGAIIFALFLLGCIIVKGPMKWALVTLTIISVLLALGRNLEWLTDLMIYNFPMYSKFRAVESILVIAEFTMPLLAVLALSQVLDGTKGEKKSSEKMEMTPIYIAFGIPAAICLLGFLVPSIFGEAITGQDRAIVAQIVEYYPQMFSNPNDIYDSLSTLRLGMLRADALRSLIFLALGFAVLYWQLRMRKGQTSTAGAAFCILLLVTFDLYIVDKRYVSHDSFVMGAPLTASIQPDAIDKAILSDTDLSYRVVDIPGFWSPTRSYFHKMVGGYHAAKLNRYEDLIQNRLREVISAKHYADMFDTDVTEVIGLATYPDSVVATLPAEFQQLVRDLASDMRMLDMLNTRYIITGDSESPVISNPDALGNAWLVDEISYVDNANAEMEALSVIEPAWQAVADKKFADVLGTESRPAPADNIELTAYTPNQLTYEASLTNDAIAVFSEVYFPWGWKATIDGNPAPIGRVNYVLRAMRLPAGEHQIVMTFDPESMHVTSAIAYICIIAIYLLLIASIVLPFITKKQEA